MFIIDGGYPQVHITAHRPSHSFRVSGFKSMAFPMRYLSLSNALLCQERQHVLYVLNVELRNGSYDLFESSDLGREPTCRLCD
jgi:hypothetical protein